MIVNETNVDNFLVETCKTWLDLVKLGRALCLCFVFSRFNPNAVSRESNRAFVSCISILLYINPFAIHLLKFTFCVVLDIDQKKKNYILFMFRS